MKIVSVIAILFGLIGVLGAVANFNFTFGVEKSAMLVCSAVILGAGLIGMAVSSRSQRSADT